MSSLFFSELKKFKLADDEESLRDTSTYQQVRGEINRRVNPLTGGIDWSMVFNLCEEIGKREGFDLLLAVYYTVAAVKIHGLRGLSNGLEIQAAVLTHQGLNSTFPAAKRIDLFNWMIGQIGKEIRAVKPGITQLRELYRCERACTALYDLLKEIQPNNVPDLEAVAFNVFEHIDRLEHPVVSAPQIIKVYAVKKFALFSALLLGVGVGILSLHFWLTMPRLMESVVVTQQTPRILTKEEGDRLIQEFGSNIILEKRDELASLYSGATKGIMERPVGEEVLETLERSESLRYLFPEDVDVIVQSLEVASWQQVLEEDFQAQMARFRAARTRAANLARSVKLGKLNKARRQSKELEKYAISLSPLYGRTLYVEELLKKNDYSGAEGELKKLSRSMNALSLKIARLERQLSNAL